jgi:hypothetical protein
MREREKFNRFINRYPHSHRFPCERPHLSRRGFFQIAGSALSGSVLAGALNAGEVVSKAAAATRNSARNVVFVLLTGAPSHTDTMDFKQSPDTPMNVLMPETIGGIVWPTGILPNLAGHLGDLCIVRSVKSWALQHPLAQQWTQIGRSPAGALGAVAPNIGSVVALEKENERQPGQVFPTFLALNSESAVGSGYFSSGFAPFKINPETSGMPDTANADGQARFELKYSLLNALDTPLRVNSPYGKPMEDYAGFYKSGRGMMFNPLVEQAFRFTAAERERYGTTTFGDACLVANKVLTARGGTRYIQITLGGWDDHQDIYTDLPPRARIFDTGLSTLMSDLKAGGLLDETLIVVMGEFGRTVGRLTAQNGRDHYLTQFAAFAGAGVRGGRAIGVTDETGSAAVEAGWSREREVRVEDIEATIYSAMGIDWTTIRYDDPFKRGFEYVPFSKDDVYGPINELWS